MKLFSTLLLLLLLAGCAQGPSLPRPATATVPAPPSATPTASPSPGPPTATPSPTLSPTPSATPTPTLPEMQVYTGADEVLRIRVPAAWEVTEEQSAEQLDITFTGSDSSLLLITIAPADSRDAAIDRFIESVFGERVPETREVLPDGTVRLTGPTGSGGRFEMRVRYQVGLLTGLIAAADAAAWEENRPVWDELFASFHLFAANAAKSLDLPQRPTLDPRALEMRSLTHYYSASGALWVVGEVANEGEVDAEGVRVTVTLLSADGREVATREGYLDQELLLAGEQAPFLLLVDDPPAPESWLALNAEVRAETATLALARAHKGLVVETRYIASQQPRLSGEVKNEGDGPASFVRVSGALYNAAGELIATTSTYLASDPLAPGASAPFELSFFDFSGDPSDIASHRVWVAGNK